MSSALGQLFLMRVRALVREPAVLFWVFVFPVITSAVLGLAFRNRTLDELAVAVVEGEDSPAMVKALTEVDGLTARALPMGQAKDALRRGKVALVLVPGDPPTFIADPTQPDGRTAKLLTSDALQRLKGREDVVRVREETQSQPGNRYIDFLIPGLLGMSLMSSGIWGVGWSLVQMRTGKLLKRLAATPMSRGEFLLSFGLSRLLLTLAEVTFFLGFARLFFGVRVFGSVASLFVLAIVGTLSFSGIAMLVASRAQNSETANGLMNLVTMPMMVLSGVFFSASHFPDWMQPFIRLLPLTGLNEGLRAVMIDGSPLYALGFQLAVMAVWGLACFGASLKLFRWT
jgi:ABC-type multidrug transport system permease subunit